MDEKVIKSEIIKLRKTILKDIRVPVFRLGVCVTVFLWILILFFDAFESHAMSEKIISMSGTLIIIFVLAYIMYFCLSIKYVSINPHRFNFERGYISDCEYIPSHVDYTNRTIEDDRPMRQDDMYYAKIKGEKFRRRTFSWVYRKVINGERYVIVLSGAKKRRGSKIIYIMSE